ncbi:MAG TPA: hypothetical protein VF727_07370 [Allosphingosinicella sp.]|jgi:hypothetical protein
MSFERLLARGRELADRRAERSAETIAGALAEAAPRGIAVERVAEGVVLSGRRLRRRFALEAGVRWLMEKVR